jgi:2-polyprenyl-3-methyl-5-hydroxy-6-metoxy-1,4-benzoquinol methylase
MQKIIHGDGQRFAPEPGQEAPIAEQTARLQFLVAHYDLNGKRVLDCGCGTGYSLPILASLFAGNQFIGIDMEQGAIEYASEKYKNLKFATMNGCCLAFPSLYFDVVLSFEVLEHLSKKQQE